jgi:hypothetical protein
MDNVDIIKDNRNQIGNLAVDGVLYGLLGGIGMFTFMAVIALLSGESLAILLARFSPDGYTAPIRGLFSHLAVSAIYGTLFGVLAWPLLTRFLPKIVSAWLGSLLFTGLLFLLSEFAVLPITKSPMNQVPSWQWALGHVVYGLVLGGMFYRKASH